MGDFRITWSGRQVDIASRQQKHEFEVAVTQAVTSDPKVYRDGRVLRELEPRVDIRFECIFNNLSPEKLGITAAQAQLLRARLENAWMYLQRNEGDVTVALDYDKTVNTTTTNDRSAGANTFTVASEVGITVGERYRLIGARSNGEANKYQLVTVESLSGSSVTIEDDLDYSFESGAHLIDEYYFPNCVIREADPPWPFTDHGELPNWFNFHLMFYMGPL